MIYIFLILNLNINMIFIDLLSKLEIQILS